MVDETRLRRFAVLIDADTTSPRIAAGLFEEIAKFGEASARRIYGDFSSQRLKSWTEILPKYAIDPHQHFAYTSGKNASDIARNHWQTSRLPALQVGLGDRRLRLLAQFISRCRRPRTSSFPTRPPTATCRSMSVQLPTGYIPSPQEAFMRALQVEYFRRKLLRLRADTQHELAATPLANTDESARVGDQADQASAAEDREFDWINRKRAQALLSQIEQALARLDDGTYGYCEDTGEPIDLRRLEAQPTATLTTEAQAVRERGGR